MILEYGDMWNIFDETDLFLITTNGAITRSGKLVMGAGIAKEANERFPILSRILVNQILDESYERYGEYYGYGLIICNQIPKIGCFQTKYDWRRPSMLSLIHFSTHKLIQWCASHSYKRVDLNYPGIGNGKLSKEDVYPIISQLPDTVHIWSKA